MVIYKSLLVDYSESACWAWPCLTFDYFSRSVMESRCSRFWMGWSFHGCIHIQNLNWQDDIGQTTIWPISRWLSDSLYCFYMYPPSSADKSSWPLIVSGGESAFGQESALPLPWLLCPGSLWPHGLSLPDSSVYGNSQARILEWVAVSISR